LTYEIDGFSYEKLFRPALNKLRFIILEALGNSMDIPLLKQMAANAEFGSNAINAIKKLQEKNLI
jgi:hypothetical protein